MDTLAYGWLSNCAIAPAIGALSVWILFMFNIYRSEWRNVDIFLVLITLQQLLSCSSIFAYSLVNIIRSRVETSCNLTVWSLTTLRIFQLSTIGSLAMDRALTLKWPYKYRFSVRSNQICYHVVVLALMSGLVGVAGVFARVSSTQQFNDGRSFSSSSSSSSPLSPSSSVTLSSSSLLSSAPSSPSSTVSILTTTSPLSDQMLSTMPSNHTQSSPGTLIIPMSSLNYQVCSLNPVSWDIRFNLFFTCLCGLLTLITLSSFVYIECNRDTNDSTRSTPKSKMLPNSRISSFGDLAIENLGSNDNITNSKYHSPSSMGSGGGSGGNEGVGVGVGVVSVNGGTAGTGSHNSLQRFYSISKEESVNSNNNFHPSHHHPNHHGNANILNHIRSSDMRWAVVVAITSLSYAVNQGPSLIFMFVGMIVPHFWTPLHDNVITWFALIEGFLLPISLYLTDDNFRDAVKLSFRRHRSSGSCNVNQEKYKASSGMINKPGFTFHYNDFVLIDKPYLGLMKSSEAKRSPSTLNLVSSSRSPYPGRHSSEILSNQGKLQSNNRVNGSSNIKPSTGLFGLGNHSKGQLARKSSHLSYIMSAEFCKKQQQSGFSFDSPSGKRFGPFFTNHNSTLNSNLTRSDDSMRKEKFGSSIARLSPMAWSVNGDNWHFSLVDRKLASTMELNDSNEVVHNDDDGKGRLIDKLSRKRKGESKDYSKTKDRFGDDVDDDGEHIYATLKVRSIGDSNSDYGCKDVTKPAVNSMITDNSGFDDASVSRLSFTTNANDDFEFHDTRESGSTIYSKPTNFGLSNGKIEDESGDSTSSGEDVSIITSDSCSSSDSDSDNHLNHQLQSQIHLKSGNNIFSQIPISVHQNRRHYSSQLLPGPNYHVNHLQMDKGNFYVNKTANLTAANPMLGYNRNKSRSSTQITNPNGGNLADYSNNKGGEEKRRGWQFFSASDLHSLENKGNENGQMKQDAYFINPLNSSKIKSPFDGHNVDGAIGSRRTMSETNLTPAIKSISQLIQQQQQQQHQQQQQQQLIYGSRDAGLYQLTRSTHNRIHLPFDPNYPQHLNQQHDTNTSSISTNSSVNSSGIGEHNKRFANLIMTGANGDRRLERISSFSKNRPRIRAQKYQLYRRAAKRQDSIKELSVDYRRNCVGSRLSLTQQDLMSGPSEPLGAFVSVKSMPDLTINSYLPIYNQLSSTKKQ